MHFRLDGNRCFLPNLFNYLPKYKDVQIKMAVADGVQGTRSTALSIGIEQSVGGEASGTVNVAYTFFTKGNTYITQYVQVPVDQATKIELSNFDLMVTKTLKFN